MVNIDRAKRPRPDRIHLTSVVAVQGIPPIKLIGVEGMKDARYLILFGIYYAARVRLNKALKR